MLQFETLEKQCQETCSSSPSIYSQFSFDSLEVHRKGNVSPDSLDNGKNGWDDDNESYMSLSIEIPRKDKNASRDSLLYNVTRYSGSEGSDTSEGTLETSRSFDNLRTWRSFDSLPLVNNGSSNKSVKEKISVENLSEDSGYSDHLVKSNSPTELKKEIDDCVMKASECFVDSVKKKGFQGFGAYDGEVFHHINGKCLRLAPLNRIFIADLTFCYLHVGKYVLSLKLAIYYINMSIFSKYFLWNC